MKAILISDKPKWCALMMNGDKTIEVRKNKGLYKAIQKLIYENGYADIYVHCSKGNVGIVRESSPYSSVPYYACVKIDKKLSKDLPKYEYSCIGKVIFKFRCYKVEEIKVVEDNNYYEDDYDYYYSTETCGSEGDPLAFYGDKQNLNELSCLDEIDLDDYLQAKTGYAIHISDLEIFDTPKELSEFNRCELLWSCLPHDCKNCRHLIPLTKAPQNFCYIEV